MGEGLKDLHLSHPRPEGQTYCQASMSRFWKLRISHEIQEKGFTGDRDNLDRRSQRKKQGRFLLKNLTQIWLLLLHLKGNLPSGIKSWRIKKEWDSARYSCNWNEKWLFLFCTFLTDSWIAMKRKFSFQNFLRQKPHLLSQINSPR